jgi:hypothetical protein
LILTSFLLTRGFWLVLLERTVIRLGWDFILDFSVVFVQVIWAIGWSMVVLSVLLFLPRGVIAAVAVGMIAFHNLFDGVEASSPGNLGCLWQVLHVQSKIEYAAGIVATLRVQPGDCLSGLGVCDSDSLPPLCMVCEAQARTEGSLAELLVKRSSLRDR